VSLKVDRATRVAEIRVLGPDEATPTTSEDLRKKGSDLWALRAFRELDDALLDLRFNHATVGLVIVRTGGDASLVRASDEALAKLQDSDWFAREVVLHMGRVLRRLDLTARSIFALIEPRSAFAGSLFELALAADRSYMFDGGEDEGEAAFLGLSPLNFGALPMSNGLSRLLHRPEAVDELAKVGDFMDASEAKKRGLVTFTPDAMDWEDEVRLAIEERSSLSPDALTGMEASLRFAGPETMETKIFGRLSAWQNWIFQRPNAVGEKGALTMYGRPERPEFDWRRT
jgi:benzoyl-CoA-dihydrodiol lyase